MAGMIPQSFINGLLERVAPVEVVSKRVQLKQVGNRHTGLCPFHDEKTPSFHVYPDGYHCFGCGAHGTSLGFLMEIDGLNFPEAVEALADIAGVEVPREQTNSRRTDPALHDALEAAAQRFCDWLSDATEGSAARAYLDERGLTPATIERFRIGLAPTGWERLKIDLKAFGENQLVSAGLLIRNDRGRTYDRFRERIVFPIRNARGRVVGFGGRVFGASAASDQPKYLNSPDTDAFHKGRELYGLFEARQANRRLASVVVVEGYMDVVALAQHGITNAVATLGTAIGQAHFDRLFGHHIGEVVCCFDGDDAGRAAAWKAVDVAFPALSAGRRLKFVFLPDGEDPDTTVQRHGAEHFRRRIQDATPVADYFFDHLQAGLDLAGPNGRALLCDLAVPHIARLPDGALRALLVRDLARLAQMEAAVIERRLRGADQVVPERQSRPAPTQRSKLDDYLLHCLIQQPQLVDAIAATEGERFRQATAATGLLGEVVDFISGQQDADTATLLGRFIGDDGYDQLASLAQQPTLLVGDALAAEFAEAVRRYNVAYQRQARAALLQNVQQSDSLDDLRRLSRARAL